ncbi:MULTISPECIES: hypothetical protein [unclassified Frankia]|uniref:hypothetical protein n=1 Tax=unclassified Frankia TaxID=2632575 RepID=UPI001EF6E016|nr:MULTISPECIES: hypothetical protein [unclassified Frankia]
MVNKRNLLAAAGVGAVLVLALPGVAFASTTATVATPGTTSWTNPAAGSLLTTSAQCSSGLVSGGGVQVTGGNGIHIMETEPSTNGTSAASNGATDPTYWLGYGGIGGNGTGTFTVQPFAVCFTNTTINHTQVVVNSTSGPTTSGGMASVTATCPANTRLLGGGAQSTLASNESVKAIASYPSDSSGSATADGGTNPTSWTAVALNGGMSGTGNTTAAFAVCSGSGINVSGITVTVKHTHVSGPTTANSAVTATSSTCGGSGNMISGGASISGGDPTTSAFTAPGSQGDHLAGDYPSDGSGNTASNGSSTTNWSATGHTGGSSSSSTYTDVWGLCMN